MRPVPNFRPHNQFQTPILYLNYARQGEFSEKVNQIFFTFECTLANFINNFD